MFAENTKSFIVTWSTLNSTSVPSIGGSWVEYGTNPRNLNQISYDQETKFTDGGNEHSVQFIHRSIVGPLAPSMVYCKYYHLSNISNHNFPDRLLIIIIFVSIRLQSWLKHYNV